VTDRLAIAACGAVLAHLGAGIGLSLLLAPVEPEPFASPVAPRSIELKLVTTASLPATSEPIAKPSGNVPVDDTDIDSVETSAVLDARREAEPKPEPAAALDPTEDEQRLDADAELTKEEENLRRSEVIAREEERQAQREMESRRKREREARHRESAAQARAEAARQRLEHEEKLRQARDRERTALQRAVPVSAGGISRGPVQVTSPRPRYPRALERKGIGGAVAVAISIDAKGRVSGVSVAHGSGHLELDRAALAAVRRWRFKPALRDGKQIASKTRVNIVFQPK
jgi:TonB family protein